MARELITAALDAISTMVLIVDEEVRIRYANAAALALCADRQAQSIVLRRAGDAFLCVNSVRGREGCGSSPECSRCVIRNSVKESLGTLTTVREKLRFERIGFQTDRSMLLTASPFEHEGQKAAIVTLEDVTEIVTLRGLIPLCAKCHKVRHESGFWEDVEHYLDTHLGADLAQAVCDDCRRAR